MATPPSISDSEWEVMNVLWSADQPLMAREVIEQLPRRIGWSPRTVKTLLNRLIKKQALHFERQGKRYLYRPAAKREECVRAESRSFLSRVFGGSVVPMLAHFVAHAELSPEELEDLQRLLRHRRQDEAGKEPKKKGR
jgi:BlaI family penicillinase repressor